MRAVGRRGRWREGREVSVGTREGISRVLEHVEKVALVAFGTPLVTEQTCMQEENQLHPLAPGESA